MRSLKNFYTVQKGDISYFAMQNPNVFIFTINQRFQGNIYLKPEIHLKTGGFAL